jgi:hypothetical protein
MQLFIKLSPVLGGGRLAKLTVAAKNKTFFGHTLLKLRLSGYSVFMTKENQPLHRKFVACLTVGSYTHA